MTEDDRNTRNATRNDDHGADDTERDDGRVRRDEGANPKLADDPEGNAIKDTEDWVTGDEAPTTAQLSYLHTLAEEAGEEVPDGLDKAGASEMIDRLQERTGRGADG